MFRIGLAVIAIGFGIQLFSGYTYTVAEPSECPPEWEGDPVTVTEVYNRAGEQDGYWCLVQGAYTQTNEPTYKNIPVGERDGYAQWWGFGIMAAGGALVLTSVLRNRQDEHGVAEAQGEIPIADDGGSPEEA